MAQRYFQPELKAHSRQELIESEAIHLIKVMRAVVGDEVILFDGQGTWATGKIVEIRKKSVVIETAERHPPQATPLPKLTLVVAPPKGERLNLIVEKVTELGIDRLEFIETSRSVVIPGSQKLQRLEQVVLSACKQSGRNLCTEITDCVPLTQWIKTANKPQRKLLIADPSGSSMKNIFQSETSLSGMEEITICIGPEGGFSPTEITCLEEQGATKVSFSPHVLRVETACLATASMLVGWFRSGMHSSNNT